MVAHKRCRDLFPKNCGFNEAQFSAVLKSLGVSIDATDEEDEGEVETDKEVLNTLVHGMKAVRSDSTFHERKSDLINLVQYEAFRERIRRRIIRNKLYQTHVLLTKFDDLEFVTMIGSGAFGKVYIVFNANK